MIAQYCQRLAGLYRGAVSWYTASARYLACRISPGRAAKSFAGLATCVFGMAASVQADTLNVAVASNFASALESIKIEFENNSEHEIRIIRGSSGKHFAQIVNGAPFDVFLSADQLRPQRLVEQGIGLEASLETYALGQLALWSRQAELTLGIEYLANTVNYDRIAIANPRLAPYGKAALEVFESLAITDQLEGRQVMGENIAQAFQYAFSGSADVGLVAYAQTLSANLRNSGSVWLVPADLHEPIRQDMLLLLDSAAAWEFAGFMKSAAVENILIDNGYLLPEMNPQS